MAAKFLYFRKDSTVANDDDVVNGSNMIAIDDIISIEATGNTAAVVRMKPRMNAFSGGEGANTDYKTDSVTLTVATNNQKAVIEAILAAIAVPQIAGSPNMINLYDAVNGTSDITGVSGASVSIQVAQA